MNKLISRPVKRFFAFGCSFTKWRYAGWAEMLGYELGVEFYNCGQPGAGNQYIFNMIMQADSFYNFNEDDLIIVEWTNVSREDKYANGKWTTPGNIYTQKDYDMKYVEKWADFEGYLIRDLAVIKAASLFLKNKKLQYHILSMAPLCEVSNQWHHTPVDNTETINNISKLYEPYIDEIYKSFYEVLWDGTIAPKLKEEYSIHNRMFNGHPSPAEHYTFLLNTFDYSFSAKTSNIVFEYNKNYTHIVHHTDFTKTSFANNLFDHLSFIKSNDIKHL